MQNSLDFAPVQPYFSSMPNLSHVSQTEIEIATQPAIWRQVAKYLPEVADKLPKHGEKVAAVGCGSSWFMSQAYAGYREAKGHGETDYYAGSEFIYTRNYDRIVVITRSGTTSEIVHLLRQTKLPSVVITAVAGSPVTEFATESIIMDFADEESVVQTRWATAALGLLRAHSGADLEKIAKDAEIALEEDVSKFAELEQISFLGHGWTVGLAQEAGLKTREAAQFWSEAYPVLDYRHGPMSIAQKGRAVWMFGEMDKYLESEIMKTGALLEQSKLDPMAHLVKAQRICVEIAKFRGLNPDQPRGLARSIILDHLV
jgi:fructoselysine-6-P-deglycase FrlB-like protein